MSSSNLLLAFCLKKDTKYTIRNYIILFRSLHKHEWEMHLLTSQRQKLNESLAAKEMINRPQLQRIGNFDQCASLMLYHLLQL